MVSNAVLCYSSFLIINPTHLCQSCPRVTFLGPDPIRPAGTLTRPDPRLPTKSLTRPDPRPDPFPNMYSLQLNNYIYWFVNYYIKYRRKSINPNVVFEDSHRFRYQEIISKKLKNPKCWPDPTHQNPAISWPDPTRPDPRVHPTRGQLWFVHALKTVSYRLWIKFNEQYNRIEIKHNCNLKQVSNFVWHYNLPFWQLRGGW